MSLKRETRQQWGAQPPKARRYVPASVAATGGVGVHYPGVLGSMRQLTHDQHRALLREWQRQHMERDSNDLEYGSLICPCGIWMEGRTEFDDWLVRVGSNGTTAANTNFTSVQLMIGAADKITENEKGWLAEAVATLREHGWGTAVRPHHFWFATACPGDSITKALPEISRMADRWKETGVALNDKDVERVAASVNKTLGDWTADGKPRDPTPTDGDSDTKPERADQRLREIEKVVRRLEKKVDALTAKG